MFRDLPHVTTSPSFSRAQPVWAPAYAGQMNVWLSFHARLDLAPSTPFQVRIAAGAVYRLWVNGEYVGNGPARTAHGFARIDEWNVETNLRGRAVVVIEVSDYGVGTFCATDEPAFCCAELVVNGKVSAWTAPRGGGFAAERRRERVQRIERFSFQRAFCEAYRLGVGGETWRESDYAPARPEKLARVAYRRTWLSRDVPYADTSVSRPRSAAVLGRASFSAAKAAKVTKRRFIFDVPKPNKGWKLSQVEEPLFATLAGLNFTTTGKAQIDPNQLVSLKARQWLRVDFGMIRTGFPALRVRAKEATRLLLVFDEILMDGEVSFDRYDCVNSVRLDLAAGADLDFQAFEPCNFQHLQVLVWTGAAEVSDVRIRNYVNAQTLSEPPRKLAPVLKMVRDAALASYRQNALDIFMDCPSRERAGWLCDSLFTARAEWHLSGDNVIERAFLENFLRPATFRDLPAGMVPMCYPAEALEKMFIPNWAMFFVLQLEEAGRARRLPGSWKPLAERRVKGLLRYFAKFENELGLLEKLENWVFVEWSKANDFVQDVNFPSNMLYASMLRAAGKILRDPKLAKKAERLEQVIHSLAWREGRFVDNAIRKKDGTLEVTNHASEVCQYYAFTYGLASPQRETALWRRLVRGDYGELYPANAFVGKLLRLELLLKHGEPAAAKRELLQNFAPMARKTGTLWEHTDIRASCDHGFTSYVAVLIDQMANDA